MSDYKKTGYLHENFKIFHLSDRKTPSIDFHFHDFHKILIFLHGNISYCIEGRTYPLRDNDIVFVHAGEVHRPILHDDSLYERIIIYISKDFLDQYQDDGGDLSLCFTRAHAKQSHVLRIHTFTSSRLGNITRELEASFTDEDYANDLYRNILFLEFMIHLNRLAIHNNIEYISNTAANEKILSIIDFLNNHLTEDINIESLAKTFYLSRYHLMHSFKAETGYTIVHYITTKRLILAKELIQGGMPVTTACYESGFRNYTTFSRAYKKNFRNSPKNDVPGI